MFAYCYLVCAFKTAVGNLCLGFANTSHIIITIIIIVVVVHN